MPSRALLGVEDAAGWSIKVMSVFAQVAILVALFIAAVFLYVRMDRWIQERYDATETGLVGGLPMSAMYRRLFLTLRVMPPIAVLAISLGFLGFGWILLAEAIDNESAKLLAYLGALVALVTALGWLILTPFMYVHLTARVRQAEAD
jgi:type IV secretory pathway TrbL component